METIISFFPSVQLLPNRYLNCQNHDHKLVDMIGSNFSEIFRNKSNMKGCEFINNIIKRKT